MQDKIPIQDFREQLRLRSAAVTSLNEKKTGEEEIPKEIAKMKRELQEKKLLEYQVKIKKGDVNKFLLSKYGEGDFNVAEWNGYDNSKARITNGITYQYHVYFDPISRADGSDKFVDRRPASHYLVTKPIKAPNGDEYIYHIPVHYATEDKTEIITDIDAETVDAYGKSVSKSGLVHALETYRENVARGKNSFDANTYSILRRHGFIKDGKFQGDVGDKLVEKYLLNINEKNKHNALVYLNEEFEKKAEAVKEETEAAVKEELKDDAPATAENPKLEDVAEAAETPTAKAPAVDLEEAVAEMIAKEEADEPIAVPKPKPKSTAPTQGPKYRSNRAFDAEMKEFIRVFLSRYDEYKGLPTYKYPYQNAHKEKYEKVFKDIRNNTLADLNDIASDEFDKEEESAYLDEIIDKIREARDDITQKIADADDKLEKIEKQASVEAISFEDPTEIEDMKKESSKLDAWMKDYDDREKELFVKMRKKFDPKNADFKDELVAELNKLTAAENEYLEKIAGYYRHLENWRDIHDSLTELKEEYGDKVNVTTALNQSSATIKLLEDAFNKLDDKKLDSIIKTAKHSVTQIEYYKTVIEKQRTLGEKKVEEAKAKAAAAAKAKKPSKEEIEAAKKKLADLEAAAKDEDEDDVVEDIIENEDEKASRRTSPRLEERTVTTTTTKRGKKK